MLIKHFVVVKITAPIHLSPDIIAHVKHEQSFFTNYNNTYAKFLGNQWILHISRSNTGQNKLYTISNITSNPKFLLFHPLNLSTSNSHHIEIPQP